jgi:5-dehydro-2-deoxygluconokinase
VKGFAIGRTIFHDVARAWFAGSMRDSDAADAMTRNLSTLVKAWHSARATVAT